MTVVVVTGGRDIEPYDEDEPALIEVLDDLGATILRHGGATGFDEWAAGVAVRHKLVVECYEADWERYGRSAGPRRNRIMLTNKPLPVALIAGPGGRGTANCKRQAEELDIPVRKVLRGWRP